jgi:hypothetical protein
MFNVNQLNSEVANEHETMSCSDAVHTAARCSSAVKIDQFRLNAKYNGF